jgi:hypothetical protein
VQRGYEAIYIPVVALEPDRDLATVWNCILHYLPEMNALFLCYFRGVF